MGRFLAVSLLCEGFGVFFICDVVVGDVAFFVDLVM